MIEQHPNLEIINRFFKAYADHDLHAMRLVVDENVKWTIPGHHPLSGTKKGIEEVIAFLYSWVNQASEPILLYLA